MSAASVALHHAHHIVPRLNHYLVLADARDKSLKLIQYSLKLYLAFFVAPHRLSKPARARIAAMMTACSNARKMIRLGHWLDGVQDLVAAAAVPKHAPSLRVQPLAALWHGVQAATTVVGLANDAVDDIYALGRFGVLPRAAADHVELLSSQLWLVGIVVALVEQARLAKQLSKELRACRGKEGEARVRHQIYWCRVSTLKLTADLLFCAWDVFPAMRRRFPSNRLQAVTGLAGGVLGSYKLWVKAMQSFTT